MASYIIRVSFFQERMQYLDQEGTVVYISKDGKETKVFPALEWLAAMCSHIPNKGEQMVRYYASRRSPFMTIISMGTLNTPGTITYIEA